MRPRNVAFVVAVMMVAGVIVSLAAAPRASADADPVQWSTSSGGNGHWYRLSPRPVNGLDDAIQLAASTSWQGQPGYVVSILSEGEKDFLVDTFGGNENFLIGYTDRDQEGTWTWVSGEPSGYEFWASNEPNNCGSAPDGSPGCFPESLAVTNWQHASGPPQPPGAWNDLPGFAGYAIFEYHYAKNDCKKGGWQGLVDDQGRSFKNQGDCVSFVATGGKNRASG